MEADVKYDRIERITMEYHRVATIPNEGKPEMPYVRFVDEWLIVDRDEQAVEHRQKIDDIREIVHLYRLGRDVEEWLDALEANELFIQTNSIPDDLVEGEGGHRRYSIVVEYANRPARMLIGSFDQNGLPVDYPSFVESIVHLIFPWNQYEIFSPHFYEERRRREGEYIYCSVSFSDDEDKLYHYIADEDVYEVDDLVVVPVGKQNRKTYASIMQIQYFPENEAPFPVERTKHIVRKATPEEDEKLAALPDELNDSAVEALRRMIAENGDQRMVAYLYYAAMKHTLWLSDQSIEVDDYPHILSLKWRAFLKELADHIMKILSREAEALGETFEKNRKGSMAAIRPFLENNGVTVHNGILFCKRTDEGEPYDTIHSLFAALRADLHDKQSTRYE